MKNFFYKIFITSLLLFIIYLLPIDIIKHNFLFFSILLIIIYLAFLYLPNIIYNIKIVKYKKNINLDYIPSEFINEYEKLFNQNKTILNNIKNKISSRLTLLTISTFILILGFCFVFNNKPLLTIICVEIGFFTGIFSLYSYIQYSSKYNTVYKDCILFNLIKLLNENLTYSIKNTDISKAKTFYKMACFDQKKYNEFYASDYIYGQIMKNTFMDLYELKINDCVGTNNTYKDNIFDGIFTRIKCKNNIKSYLRISINNIHLHDQKYLIKLDGENFEKYFNVYAENKIIAKQILTSDVMENLIDFHNKYNLDFDIVFRNDCIYLRFFTGPMFEPKIFGTPTENHILSFQYIYILNFILDIASKLTSTLNEI